MSYDVVVIGGGAAGLMCAIQAGQRGRQVLVLERSNRVGKKILMSGGGRCNFTNLYTTAANYLSTNPHFCKSALARYTPGNFIELVERHGIAYHEKELGQLFCDVSAKLIVNMLVAECQQAGVRIETNAAISEVVAVADGFTLRTADGQIQTQSLVVASGGLSIPKMGGSGFGYALAQQFGHSVLKTRAGLVPLTFTAEDLARYADLSGLSLPVSITLGRQSFSNQLLFTHRGISGPVVLQISSYWQQSEKQALQLDLLPNGDALSWLQARQAERPAAELKTVLSECLPKRLAQRLCELQFENRLLRQYQPAQLQQIAERLHAWAIQPAGTEGYRTAEVTLGGVDTRELSSSTMESKHQPGLYFIGEVVDVTGHLGGFNFQWAWASGYAAGQVV